VRRAAHPLPRSFFGRPTLQVARSLLGRLLVRETARGPLVARIVETEAYIGEDDPASHAAPGPTARNAVMYGPPGFAYVYFIYGVHHCLNVVTEREGFPAAVLIRAAEPLEGLEGMRRNRGVERADQLASGPGKLAQAFGLTRAHSGVDLTRGTLVLARGAAPRERIAASTRIGIRKAVELPWRFYLEGNPHVSRR
jgi:DNA-3-methyladenine glycosylase